MPGGDQLRVRNGIYLANWRLNRREDATDSFGNVVDYSLSTKKLSVRFLFRPGSTQFLDETSVDHRECYVGQGRAWPKHRNDGRNTGAHSADLCPREPPSPGSRSLLIVSASSTLGAKR
jgi:hypothetical protein